MDCNIYQKTIPHFADGDLNQANMEAFRKHTEQCPGCRAHYQRFMEIYSLAGKDKIVSDNPYLFTRIMASIEAKREATKHRQSFALKPVMLAASIAIPLFLGILFGYSFVQQEQIKRDNANLIQNMNTLLTYTSNNKNEYLNIYEQD